MANSNLILKNGTATTDETSISLNAQDVFFIANDTIGGGDLYVGFDEHITESSEYLIVKSGEKFENLGVLCNTMYLKSSVGDVVYRAYARKVLR